MKRIHGLLAAVFLAAAAGSLLCGADAPAKSKKKILFFSPSFGFRHSVVARPLTGELSHAEKVFKEIAVKAGYEVFVSQDYNDLKEDQFKQYDAIVFYTSGNPPIGRENLLKWIREGGAFIGIHAATDSYKDWPEYVKTIGGVFSGHGGNQKPLTLKIEDAANPATKVLGGEWVLADEIYQFQGFSRDNVHMLLSVDADKTPEENLKHHNMKKDGYYPIAWTNTLGKGRVFYTSLGHQEDVWTDPTYQKHLLGGIGWALATEK